MSRLRVSTLISAVAALVSTTLIPVDEASAAQCGKASWYALHSRTASGTQMRPSAMTAAHRTLALGTRVRVDNLTNGKSIVVNVNDRGPFVSGRLIDLSKGAASRIGMIDSGIARVRMTALGKGGSTQSGVWTLGATQREDRGC